MNPVCEYAETVDSIGLRDHCAAELSRPSLSRHRRAGRRLPVPAPDGPRPAPGRRGLDAAFGGRLAATLTAVGFTGKPGEIAKMPTFGALHRARCWSPSASATPRGATATPRRLRRAAGAAVRSLAGTAPRRARPARRHAPSEAEAVALGALLGAYSFARYRTGGEPEAPVAELTVLSRRRRRRGRRVARAADARRVRHPGPRPGQHPAVATCGPASFAEIAEQVGGEAGLSRRGARREGARGGRLRRHRRRRPGLGQPAAPGPPRLQPPRGRQDASRSSARASPSTPAACRSSRRPSMDWMKSDMGGAGAVLGALVGDRQARACRSTSSATSAMAENMPSGTAQRPSDVHHQLRRQDRRGAQHRRRGPPGPGRRHRPRRRGRPRPDRRRRHPHRRPDRRARLAHGRRHGQRRRRARAGRRGGRRARARPPGACRCPRSCARASTPPSPTSPTSSRERWGGMLAAGIFLREFVPDGRRAGRTSTWPARLQQGRAARLHAEGRHRRRHPHPRADRRGRRRAD